jgi:predicted NBD/HSP70 family sugar kinase
VPEAALVIGIDVGARFVRGELCDLHGSVRARPEEERGAEALTGVAALHDGLVDAAGLPGAPVDRVVVGVPGVPSPESGVLELADNVPELAGTLLADELSERLGRPVQVETDINLAALGEQWRGVARGVEDFAFLSIGTGLGAGVVLRGERHRGRHGAAGELDFATAGTGRDLDPCAEAVSGLAVAAGLAPPYDVPSIFAAARAGVAEARVVVDEEARRIALHIVPLAAVADVALVVIGGGLSAGGDLLLAPVRALLAEWLPYPPRVELSGLGDAAVLTGALSVGVRAALDSVFVNRRRA